MQRHPDTNRLVFGSVVASGGFGWLPAGGGRAVAAGEARGLMLGVLNASLPWVLHLPHLRAHVWLGGGRLCSLESGV